MLWLRPVDAGRWIALEPLYGLGVAPRNGLLRGTKLGFDPPPRLHVPPPPGEEQAGAGGEQQKYLRHRSESETRPERTRFDRRDEIGGKPARRKVEVEGAALGKDAAPATEP
jgi:hypothetical protein